MPKVTQLMSGEARISTEVVRLQLLNRYHLARHSWVLCACVRRSVVSDFLQPHRL